MELNARRLEAAQVSASSYLKLARAARVKFQSTGDLGQSEWADKYLQAAKMHAATVVELGGVVDAPELLPIEAVEVPEVEQPKVRARCPHYHLIRELFAVAREKGFDVSDAARDRMRGAIGMLLGRRIESRSDLTGSEWGFCTNAVRMGRLFW